MSSLFIAFILMLTTITTSVSAAGFRDTSSHWAKEAIEKWSDNGVVTGYQGAFRPNDAVTRAEFASMIDKVVHYIETGKNSFSDLSSDKWYYDSLLKLSYAGIVNGTDGKAWPEKKITRQEAAVMLFKAFHLVNASGTVAFKDEQDISEWAKEAVNALVSKKVITGTPKGEFKPLANLTRAEAVTLFSNLFQTLISKPGSYSENVKGNLVVNTPNVVLNNMNISGDLYITEGVGAGEVTLNNVKVTGSVFVRGGGEHSIIFNSVDVKGSLVVNKNDGKIRILATGNTSISVTVLESGALLVTKDLVGGGFETVEIPADILEGQKVVLDGNFSKVNVNAAAAPLTVNGTIKELSVSVNTNISGNVKIDKVNAPNGTEASVNGKPAKSDQPGNNNAPASGTPGGTPSGGTPSGGTPSGGTPGGTPNGGTPGDSTPTIPVTGISIANKTIVLSVGGTKQLVANIQPHNATNKNISWKINAEGAKVVTVDDNGRLTAIGKGTATVTVITQDGAKSDQAAITVKAADEIEADDIFAPIEQVYLDHNASASSITSNLNLLTSLAEFPGVTIAWKSDNLAVLTNGGVVTRDEKDDKLVKLTATLSGAITASKTFELIIRAKGTDQVEIGDFVDPHFVDGYPQAYVKNGKIWVRYKLNTPAEVYMVVNAINGYFESSVKSVLEGHAGKDNQVISVDDWPYFNVTNIDELQEFDTGVTLRSQTARVEFVIRDAAKGYTSSKVTTIKFDQETVDALDTYPPYLQISYINRELNTLYVYFDEWLDMNSVPAPSDFALNYGSVEKVSLSNYKSNHSFVSSYVKLTVSGIEDENKNNLKLTYKGTALQDVSDQKNKVSEFTDRQVNLIDPEIVKSTISSDRSSMIVNIVPGWNWNDNESIKFYDPSLFKVTIAGVGTYSPSSTSYSYSLNNLNYSLVFDSPLPAGKASITMNTKGILDWAMNPYPDELSLQNVTEIPVAGTPTGSYAREQIQLTFADGFKFGPYGSNAAGFVLLVDNVEYALRGSIIWGIDNKLTLNLYDKYSARFKAAIEAGETIKIKYARANGNNRSQLSDAAGAFVSDFDYVTVSK